MQSTQKKQNVIRICRTVYSMEELLELEQLAERGGARILSKTIRHQGAIISVSLELDRSKRQF